MERTTCNHCGEALPMMVDAFCPYCREPFQDNTASGESVDSQGDNKNATPDFDPLVLETATMMIRQGATPGMVKMELRKKGVPEAECREIVKQAQGQSTLQVRAKGTRLLFGGAGLILLGIGTIWLRIVVNHTGRAPSFGLIAAGAAVFVKGLLDVMSGVEGGKA